MKQEKDKLMESILELIGAFADKHGQILYHIHFNVDKKAYLKGFETRWKHKTPKGTWI